MGKKALRFNIQGTVTKREGRVIEDVDLESVDVDPTADAVEILHRLFVGKDPKRLAALEDERRRADLEQEEYDRTGYDPYE